MVTMTLPGSMPPDATEMVRRRAGHLHGLENIRLLLEYLTAEFHDALARHQARCGGALRFEAGASGELAFFFAFYDMQKAVLNWGACQGLVQDDLAAFRQARFLASRVSWLKQVSLLLPYLPPNAMRDHWDRLFSLGCDDWACVHAQTARLPEDAREGVEQPPQSAARRRAGWRNTGFRRSRRRLSFDERRLRWRAQGAGGDRRTQPRHDP